jgi:hypothetical protein
MRERQIRIVLEDTRKKIVEFANLNEVGDDWHEPDCPNGVKAKIRGIKFDNAHGDNGGEYTARNGKRRGPYEMIVTLTDDNGRKLKINLATLFALATMSHRNKW